MTDPHPLQEKPLVSVIIPVYLNEENIPVTWPAVRAALQCIEQEYRWELVFVDDGSADGSFRELSKAYQQDPAHVRIIKLTRNFGQVAAILAGFKAVRGSCGVVLSADLQDPPELIGEMVSRWNQGTLKIVLATRTHREDGWFARWGSRTFYRLMRRYAVPSMPEGGFDFFLVDRCVIDLINKTEEKNTFLQGQILWTGFPPYIIEYARQKRELGRSRWTLSRKVKYLTDGFVTYSVFPIRVITAVGLLASAMSFTYASVIIVGKLVWDIPLKGWPPIMVSILGLSGVQLVMLGVIGEYLWRNYYETRKLPNYVIESITEAAPGALTEQRACKKS